MLFTTVIPSKMFECMGMGIPVLHGVQGESAIIVEREGVGLLFEPESAEGLIKGLLKMANDHNTYSRIKAKGPVAAKKYDRSILAHEMLNILKDSSNIY